MTQTNQRGDPATARIVLTVLVVVFVALVLLVGGVWILWENLSLTQRAAVHIVIDYLLGRGGAVQPQ